MSDIVDLIKIFLKHENEYVSGSDLAERFRVSRVAIRKRIEILTQQGFKFSAIRNRGYLLEKLPTKINENLITAYCEFKGLNTSITHLESVDSTNSEAERLLAKNTPDPFFILSSKQTAGRGRLGRIWHSPNENNIYLSAAFRPKIEVRRMQLITPWLGLKICQYLNLRFQIPVKIKWPNDIILDDRKVAGMLTEARIDSDRMRDLVFGIGINVNSDPKNIPAELKNSAISLSQAYGLKIDINDFAASIINVVNNAYKELRDLPISERLIEEWGKFDYLRRKEISTDLGNGKAEGIDSVGSLILRLKDGTYKHLKAGEVTIGSQTIQNSTRVVK